MRFVYLSDRHKLREHLEAGRPGSQVATLEEPEGVRLAAVADYVEHASPGSWEGA